jgi:hypothetical protein
MVGVQPYNNRVLVKVSDAPSISSEIVVETQGHREIGMERRLSFMTDAPLPHVDSKKPKNEMTFEEQWVTREREKRRKEMAQRAAMGNPMSVLEQVEEERKMMAKLQLCTNIKDLLEEQETDLRGSLTEPAEVAYVKSSGRFRQPDSFEDMGETSRINRRDTEDDDQEEEVPLKSVMGDVHTDINKKRDRSPTPPGASHKKHRSEDDVHAQPSSSSSSLWTAQNVSQLLIKASATLPPGTEVSSYVDTILGLLSKDTNWTETKLRAEVRQVVDDVVQELGADHPALEAISSLRAEM